MFFCGVYFPITVLPGIIRPISYFMPFYYSIEGLRLSLIPSTPISQVLSYVLLLVLLSILFISLGIVVLHAGLRKAKKDGSLTFY
jgi:ABC-2 type transport system permease protein